MIDFSSWTDGVSDMRPTLRRRPAKQKDIKLLARWNRELIDDEGFHNPMTHDQLEARMQDWLEERYEGSIFEMAEEPVGYCLYGDMRTHIFVRHFFISRAHRRRGIGVAAIRLMRQTVWGIGKEIAADVLTGNIAGRAFWLKAGFQEASVCVRSEAGRALD